MAEQLQNDACPAAPPTADRQETREAWTAEIERRARRVLSRQSSGESWEAVRARAARCLSER